MHKVSDAKENLYGIALRKLQRATGSTCVSNEALASHRTTHTQAPTTHNCSACDRRRQGDNFITAGAQPTDQERAERFQDSSTLYRDCNVFKSIPGCHVHGVDKIHLVPLLRHDPP